MINYIREGLKKLDKLGLLAKAGWGGGVRGGLKGPTCYMVYSVGVKCAKHIPKPYNRAQVLWGGRGERRFSLKPKSVLFFFKPSLTKINKENSTNLNNATDGSTKSMNIL